MLSSWVNGGGHLIAMRPDEQLATLLGLTTQASTLSNASSRLRQVRDLGQESSNRRFSSTVLQIYIPSAGATAVATLYSGRRQISTAFPAVTLARRTPERVRQLGIYLRSGASSSIQTGESGVGSGKIEMATPPFRSNDTLLAGAASFDPQSDWVDSSKVAIPQADEQRGGFLANLILQMKEIAHKPLPRFWYFPSGFKAALVLTGDDHGSFSRGSATSQRFDGGLRQALRDAGQVRPIGHACGSGHKLSLPPNPWQATRLRTRGGAYLSQGFEIAMRGDPVRRARTWTTSQLGYRYISLLSSFATQFPSLPAPRRPECIAPVGVTT